MIEVDRAMIEDARIDLVQMMENAGRNLAHLARQRFFNSDPRHRHVVVLAGAGGNGGGALVCGRRLHNWGADVTVVLTKAPQEMTPVPRHQLDILQRMGVRILQAAHVSDAAAAELIVDGIIGYRLGGDPRGTAADLIRWANDHDAPVLSLDVPSGVDTSTGTVRAPAVEATVTMTLALPKEGLRQPDAASHIGELYLADISVPPGLYARPPLGLDVGPIFASDDIVRLR